MLIHKTDDVSHNVVLLRLTRQLDLFEGSTCRRVCSI